MTMFAYSALLTLALVLSCPWWLTRMVTTQRYREGLKQRLGSVPAALRDYAANHRIVWLHAVSVGEVLAASRLIAELETALGANFRIVISTTTSTGQALARDRFTNPSDGNTARVFYLPLDFAFAIRAYLNALKPAALILMESELWPRLLHECTMRKIPVAVTNARLSDRSYRRAQRIRAIWSHVLRKPTLWLTQSEEDTHRLLSLIDPTHTDPVPDPTQPNSVTDPTHPDPVIVSEGARTCAAQSKDPQNPPLAPTLQTLSATEPSAARAPTILTTGNLKYDIRAPKQSRIANLIREAAAGRPIIVAGSTVDRLTDNQTDENEKLISATGGLRKQQQGVLVLAPRHPELFDLVYSVAMEYPTLRATELPAAPQKGPVEIILLDTIGDLASVYSIATIAFVGGSLVPRGGHNPLEPAQFGVPVVMGPSFQNFRDIVSKLQAADGIRIVQDAGELETALTHLLAHRKEALALGQRGRAVFEAQQGATTRTVAALLQTLHLTATNAGAPYLDSEMRAATEAKARR